MVNTWSIFGPGKNTQQKWPAPLTCRQLLVFSFFETTAFLRGLESPGVGLVGPWPLASQKKMDNTDSNRKMGKSSLKVAVLGQHVCERNNTFLQQFVDDVQVFRLWCSTNTNSRDT